MPPIEPRVTHAIKYVAREEVVVMRKDFRESYSTYPGDFGVPLGRSEQFRYGSVSCVDALLDLVSITDSITFLQVTPVHCYCKLLFLKNQLSRLYLLSILEHIHYFIID